MLKVAVAVFAAVALFAPAKADAASISFELDILFGSATPPTPAGDAPWLIATFDDQGTPGSVLLTLDATGLSGGNFVRGGSNGGFGWGFNYDPAKVSTLGDLVFTPQSGTAAHVIHVGEDAFKADGDGYFDIRFSWSSSNSLDGGTVQYLITGPGDLGAADFNFFSAPASGGGPGPFTSAAKIQGIGPQDLSVWVGSANSLIPPAQIPEPGAVALLGLGLLGAGIVARLGRRRK
jgi:hypothetical protein